MEGAYGAGTYCTGEGEAKQCRQLGDLEDVLRSSRDYDAQLDAWQGWHSTAKESRRDYARFVELVNEGATEQGHANAGAMWRAGYDMPAEQFAAETDRLWEQVRPLYEQLHCFARDRLQQTYGVEKGQVGGGLIPAHLTGNMWQQDWGNLWDILQPYPGAGSLDITAALEKQYQQDMGAALAKRGSGADAKARFEAGREAQLQVARQMTERAQDFYVSLGMPKLPESYWAKTQFIKPLDRDVVCHASAWDMDMGGDVRTKMCIKPNEEDFTTIYHELGHLYYDPGLQPAAAAVPERRQRRFPRGDRRHHRAGDDAEVPQLDRPGGHPAGKPRGGAQQPDAHGPGQGRVPAVRVDDRPLALGRVRRLDQPGPLQ